MIKLDKVRWGFIGCGEVTEKKSGPAFNMIEGSKVVAVMSRDEEKVKSYAIRHNIPRWYTDAQELIGDEDVNAIYIATPPSSHATFAIMAMKAGKPVYIEKPMAASYEDCARINRISKETGIPCFVAYYRRYLPYFQKVRQLVEEGEIGNVINIQIRFAQPPACAARYSWRRLFLQPRASSARLASGDVRLHTRSRRIQEQPWRTIRSGRYHQRLLQIRDRTARLWLMVFRSARVGKGRPYRNNRR